MKKSLRMLLVGASCTLGLGALANIGAFALSKESKETKAEVPVISGGVYVGDVILTENVTYKPDPESPGFVKYTTDAANNQATIILNNVSIDVEGYSTLGYTSALTVTLTSDTNGFVLNVQVIGNNSITEVSTGNVKSCGFFYTKYSSTGAVKFIGDSTSKLQIYGGGTNLYSAGMYSQTKVFFDGPEVKMTAGGVEQSGGKTYGLHAYKGFKVISGKVSLIGGDSLEENTTSYGVYIANDNGEVTGGEFEAKGDGSSEGKSIGLSVYNNSRVILSGGKSYFYGKTHGIDNTEGWNYANLEVERTIEDVTIKSNNTALVCDEDLIYLKNKVPGTGWMAYDRSDVTPGSIAVSSGGQFLSTAYKVINFQGAVVKATITGFTGPYDGNPHSISITNLDPANATVEYRVGTSSYSSTNPTFTDVGEYTVYYRLSAAGYDNNEGSAQVIIQPLANGWSTTPVGATSLVYNNGYQSLLSTLGVAANGTVEYSIDGGEFSANIPTAKDAGTYEVTCRINAEPQYEAVANQVVEVTIAKGSNQYTSEPSAIADLAYTGQPLVLSSVGSVLGGSVLYKVDSGEYSSELPTAVTIGTHTVYYKTEGNSNYNAIAERSFNVEIGLGVPTYGAEPAALANLNYTGQDRALVSEGSSNDGEVLYSLTGEGGSFTNAVPTGKNVGEYTVYYMIEGDANHNDSAVKSVKANIVENDKTALVASITKAETLYNNIKEAYPEVAETLKGATDAAKAINNNANVTIKQIEDAVTALNAAIEKAIADSRDVVVDENSGVSVKTSDGTAIPTNINLKVEVRSDVKANKETAKDSNVKQFVESNEYISYIYDIKLIKTEDGVESEIQPSEIEEGLKIIVTISLPEDVDGGEIRLLHIHSSSDIEVVENFTSENGQISFEINKLSQIALLSKSRASAGLPAWVIVLIVLGSLILVAGICYLVFFFLLNKWIKKEDKALRVFRLGKKEDKVVLFTMFFRVEYRKENEVFNSKEEALK